MAYKNFQPVVWSAEIERELERMCVFAEDCNRKFEGDVENHGDSVKILGVGKPTITVVAKGQRRASMPERETIDDTSVIMYINQMAIFNYEIEDIDKAQMKGDIKTALNEETSAGVACAIDKHVAEIAVGSEVSKLFGATPKTLVSGIAGDGQINILTMLDVAAQKLYENDVPTTGEQIVATLPPGAHRLFKEAYRTVDTNNHELMKNGKVGMYNGMIIKMSNNVHKTALGDNVVEHISIRTRKAVALAIAKTHTEAYRPEEGFADAVKGYTLYQAQVVRPKEAVDANVIVPAAV